MRIFALAAIMACSIRAQETDPWKPLEFLIGVWTGEGGGGPGQGGGEFSFQFDLANKVMIRRSYAEYPAQNGRPAFRHDDLMIVYLDESSHRPRAIYFDNEGHTIRYSVASSAAGLVFESESGEPGARYRLTYTPTVDRIAGKFEIRAPADAAYKTYIDFSVRRKSRNPH